MFTTRPIIKRRPLLAAALLLCAAISAARAAEPPVLQQVPADAYAVVVVNNARTFANKVSNAATRLNLPLPPDLVGYATRNLGIVQGFDANASAALVLLKPSADRLAEGYFSSTPPMVVLLPTTNAKDMLANFKPGDPDAAGISQVSLPNNPEEKGFVAVVADKWVALAQTKEDLAAYLARGESFAKAAAPETLKVFDANDLVIWGNVEKLGAGADKWIDDQQINLTGMMELGNQINKLDPMSAALQKQFLVGFFSLAKEFIKDAGAGMVTARVTDSGATLGLVGDFKPASPMGKFVASQAAAGDVSLKGLPTGGFLVAGATRWNSAAITPVYNNFVEQVFADPAISTNERAADMRKALDIGKQMLDITQGASFILLDPPAGGKNGFICGSILIDTTDPQKFIDLQLQNVKSAFAQQSMGADFKQTFTATPNAVTIKDVRLSKINMRIELRAETPDNPVSAANKLAFQMIQKIYGPDGITAYLGVVGKRVIMIYGSDNVTLESSVAAAQANSMDLAASPAIAATKEQLVEHPITIMYLPITRWMTLAQSILKPPADGDPAPSPNVANAPPVVMSTGINGHLVTTEIHVPITTIIGTQEAFQRLERALQGGAP